MNDKLDNARRVGNIVNPRELMRARHPDLFSDAVVQEEHRLPRAVFEYHLDTLTNRKQEYEFEHFCRKLAEKEICPNLRAQTGPTGGGDSKVDSETYPVAPEISERWWIAEPAAGGERWAFAFSAKKAWKQKAKSDAAKIIATGRDYKRIYFFTNQFVSDKERAKQEDALTQKSGIPVHILDRTWIVDKVYNNKRLGLAASALGLEGATEKSHRPGPRDTERLAELEELDKQVADPDRYQNARYQLVEDCLRTAILARGLERPRNEVDSRFAHAERLATDLGIRQQQMRVAYSRAWTAHWWHEDYVAFCKHYDQVGELVKGSDQASDAERLVALWQLLPPLVVAGHLSAEDARVKTRQERLLEILKQMSTDSSRPNNALQARTFLALVNAIVPHLEGRSDEQEGVWEELSEIVDESVNLGSYPLEQLSDLIRKLGDHVDSRAFDTLYQKLVDVVRQRRSEGEAGQAYRDRGVQKLEQKKPYEAIKWFGRAEELLVKDEYREELVVNAVASSLAYERVGLLWAARGKLMIAAERTLGLFRTKGQIIRPALLPLERLVWIELQLGRVPHVLEAMRLASFVASQLNLPDKRQASYKKQFETQEVVLGIHFLNLSHSSLPKMVQIPDVFERIGFTNARLALLFALGQEKAIFDEGYVPKGESTEKIQEFFERWHDQPATKDLAAQPVLVIGPTSSLRCTILGSEIIVETPNNATAFGLAESLLGAIEALLATSNETHILPHRERVSIKIIMSDHSQGTPSIRFFDDDVKTPEIACPSALVFNKPEDYSAFTNWLRETVIQLLPRIFAVRDIKEWFEQIGDTERAFSRAFLFGDGLTLNRNVFEDGGTLFGLGKWIIPQDKTYECLRAEHWRAAKARASDEAEENVDTPIKFGDGPPPEGAFDNSRLKHTDRRVHSVIDVSLWDRARWQSVLFLTGPVVPVLGIVFSDEQAATLIFKSFFERWGDEDANNALRVAIVTGTSSKHPARYAVSIGPSFSSIRGEEGKIVTFVSRIHHMGPETTENLDRFIAAFNHFKVYELAPAIQKDGAPYLSRRLRIKKYHLEVRPAWQIGENDPDLLTLDEDDLPVVPSDESDPPVRKALERLRDMRRKSGKNEHET